MAGRVTILGRERLARKLAALPAAAEAEIRKALEAAAEEIAGMARRLLDSGALRDSIGWSWGEAPSGARVLAKASAAGGRLSLVVFAGNDDAFYARWVEFGTVKTLPQPFLFPSYRALRKRAKGKVNRAIRTAARRVAAAGNG